MEISDARYCVNCGTEYQYTFHTYAHLGGFVCPKCGYHRTDPSVAVTSIDSMTARESRVHMNIDGFSSEVTVGIPAVYNIYNAAAAVCAYPAAGFPPEEMLRSLADVHSSFGRMENFRLGQTDVQMILVKNPAGCNQALAYLKSLGVPYNAVFCLNDRTADGHDISWIWDADFEQVCKDPHLAHIYVWGDRAEDMQLRLKYADAPEDRITCVRTSEELLRKMQESRSPVFVLPNYTSMLELRRVLSEATGKQEFWKG